MASKVLKILGGVIGVVGVAFQILKSMPYYANVMSWINSSDGTTYLSGWLFFAVIITTVVSVVGVLLCIITKHWGGMWLTASGTVLVIAGVFLLYFTTASPKSEILPLLQLAIGAVVIPFALEAILYLVGGIVASIGEKSD